MAIGRRIKKIFVKFGEWFSRYASSHTNRQTNRQRDRHTDMMITILCGPTRNELISMILAAKVCRIFGAKRISPVYCLLYTACPAKVSKLCTTG